MAPIWPTGSGFTPRAGRLPAPWDGRAAERIVDVLMSTWR